MYKVFVKNKVILFTNKQTKIPLKYSSFLKINFFEADIVSSILRLLTTDNKIEGVLFYVEDVEKAFKGFKESMKIIFAAGGVVKNNENKTLFIYRLDKWDLPKGKVEENEKIEEAAIREVEEECAVNGLEIKSILPDTFHIYTLGDELVLKQTYWFEMVTYYSGELKPQTEEGIQEVKWMSDEEIENVVLKNTYKSIANFLTSIQSV